MQIALYTRVSVQRMMPSPSVDQQLERLHAYVAQHPDWQLVPEHIYRDDGYSGAHLARPGLDRLRAAVRQAAFTTILITAPDRLARNYVHQQLLMEEFAACGCHVQFLERPVEDTPHDQLVLQIRGAVAEYERSLITERLRRGRRAKLESGQLLPWTRPAYGYLLDPAHPRDPRCVQVHPAAAAVVRQIFAWYTEPATEDALGSVPVTLYTIVQRLNSAGILAPSGGMRWNTTTVRNILRNPAYTGLACGGRYQTVAVQRRKSALRPVGRSQSQRLTDPAQWVGVPVPVIISAAIFAQAQAQLARNQRQARRNNTTYEYLLRGLVSCGRCHDACSGRTSRGGYSYYVCGHRTNPLRRLASERCTTRFTPAAKLDELVWQDVSGLLQEPERIVLALERAQAGAWLPQAQQARRQLLEKSIAQVERQLEKLLEVYLAEVISRDEFVRKRQELEQVRVGLGQQERELAAQIQQHDTVAEWGAGIVAFCERVRPTLAALSFAQRRQLLELVVDQVVVEDGNIEIRYVIPTGPQGERIPFCQLHKDYRAAV